ncbi:hypothetical protein [Nocardiopsis metallicus]
MDLASSLITAAQHDGLHPVVEAAGTVDLQIRDGDRVVAAIRVHLGEDWCVHEIPARTSESDLETPLTQPWARGAFRLRDMRDLDMWWARVPGTHPTWKPAQEPWMRAGHWQRRGILTTH